VNQRRGVVALQPRNRRRKMKEASARSERDDYHRRYEQESLSHDNLESRHLKGYWDRGSREARKEKGEGAPPLSD
jgi:hypothetical protein